MAVQVQAQITRQQSMAIIKNIMRTAINSVAYMRGLFPEECFNEKPLAGLTIHVVQPSSHPEARLLMEWLERGVFDSLEKRYLDRVVFAVFSAAPKLLEEYHFVVAYDEGVTVDIQNGKSAKASLLSKQHIQGTTCNLLRTLTTLCSTLGPLPAQRHLEVRLLYTENTPDDYEPVFFSPYHESSVSDSLLSLLPVGGVSTPFHSIHLSLASNCNLDNEENAESKDEEIHEEPSRKDAEDEDTPPKKISDLRALKSSEEQAIDVFDFPVVRYGSKGTPQRGRRKSQLSHKSESKPSSGRKALPKSSPRASKLPVARSSPFAANSKRVPSPLSSRPRSRRTKRQKSTDKSAEEPKQGERVKKTLFPKGGLDEARVVNDDEDVQKEESKKTKRETKQDITVLNTNIYENDFGQSMKDKQTSTATRKGRKASKQREDEKQGEEPIIQKSSNKKSKVMKPRRERQKSVDEEKTSCAPSDKANVNTTVAVTKNKPVQSSSSAFSFSPPSQDSEGRVRRSLRLSEEWVLLKAQSIETERQRQEASEKKGLKNKQNGSEKSDQVSKKRTREDDFEATKHEKAKEKTATNEILHHQPINQGQQKNSSRKKIDDAEKENLQQKKETPKKKTKKIIIEDESEEEKVLATSKIECEKLEKSRQEAETTRKGQENREHKETENEKVSQHEVRTLKLKQEQNNDKEQEHQGNSQKEKNCEEEQEEEEDSTESERTQTQSESTRPYSESEIIQSEHESEITQSETENTQSEGGSAETRSEESNEGAGEILKQDLPVNVKCEKPEASDLSNPSSTKKTASSAKRGRKRGNRTNTKTPAKKKRLSQVDRERGMGKKNGKLQSQQEESEEHSDVQEFEMTPHKGETETPSKEAMSFVKEVSLVAEMNFNNEQEGQRAADEETQLEMKDYDVSSIPSSACPPPVSRAQTSLLNSLSSSTTIRVMNSEETQMDERFSPEIQTTKTSKEKSLRRQGKMAEGNNGKYKARQPQGAVLLKVQESVLSLSPELTAPDYFRRASMIEMPLHQTFDDEGSLIGWGEVVLA